MTRYWVAALIAAVVVLFFVVRWMTRPRESIDDSQADVLIDELGSERGELDDTAPAVLSPPEWTAPKSVSNGSRRNG